MHYKCMNSYIVWRHRLQIKLYTDIIVFVYAYVDAIFYFKLLIDFSWSSAYLLLFNGWNW